MTNMCGLAYKIYQSVKISRFRLGGLTLWVKGKKEWGGGGRVKAEKYQHIPSFTSKNPLRPQ
jgi:hypothetical protein